MVFKIGIVVEIYLVIYAGLRGGLDQGREREREREFNLKPMGPGRWHITADAAEKRLPRSGPFVDNFFFVGRERESFI